ncbi:tyrosine-type recombinase/integrase [Fodinicola acaciae]|uniref:tyrosine-type recombinase/integrase n=1 Tax=Fodinicola acaciae TaxID=2681555 RepID=UPI0013D692C8|nr:tyrosine-type recombinase/integrase [Fodinicola acaciae]
MPLLDLDRLTAGLSTTWSSYLRDWDRTLRSGNHPETTRYNYLLAAAQLARYLEEYSPDPDADAAAADPTLVSRAHVEAFQAWMIQTRSASTALNKHKALQQFFKWLELDEGDIDASPMRRVRQPRVDKKLVPVIGDADTAKVLDTCKTHRISQSSQSSTSSTNGEKRFIQLRDEAIIRLYYNTGARLSEVANLGVDDLDMSTETAMLHGKGGKQRRVRFGPKTARALSRYLRARAQCVGADLSHLWLASRGKRHLAANVTGVHAHRWRHNFAHEWKLGGGDTGDLMLLMGWTSEEMARHYGASAAAERAQQIHARMGVGERV